MTEINISSSGPIAGKGKPGFLGTIRRFFSFAFLHSWGGRIGAIAGIVAGRLIQQDDDGNLLVTVVIILICGLTGVIIEKIATLLKKLIRKG